MTDRRRINAALWFLLVFIALATVSRGADVSQRFPVVASAVFAGVMLLAIAFLGAAHPFERFGPGNQVTAVRSALVALAAGLIPEPPTSQVATAAVILASAVTALDGVDGWLARRSRMASPYGARFDLEVDAFLIMVLAILAWRHGQAGAWVLLSGLTRYAFVAAGAVWSWMRRLLPPSRRRQTICVVQIAGLILVMVPFVRPPLSSTIAALSLAVLWYSFLVDTLWLWKQAR
jgi:phosphatidylglycerophosphate synthase